MPQCFSEKEYHWLYDNRRVVPREATRPPYSEGSVRTDEHLGTKHLVSARSHFLSRSQQSTHDVAGILQGLMHCSSEHRTGILAVCERKMHPVWRMKSHLPRVNGGE